MSTFNKTILAVLALKSTTVFAGIMGPVCMVGDVTAPCANARWDVGVDALYLKPSYSDVASWIGNNNTLITTATTTTSTDHLLENKPDWRWGFKLQASYYVHTDNDINLNWYHLGHRTTNFNFVRSSTDTDTQTFSNRSSLLSVSPKWDAVNLEFGQHVDFGTREKIRFHGGVQYVAMKTNWSTLVTQDEFTLNALVSSTTTQSPTTSLYNGFGPRVGADMSYELVRGLAMYVNGAPTIPS